MEPRIEDCLGFPYMEQVHATASLKKWLSVCYCSSELHVIFFHSYAWLYVKIIVTVPLCVKKFCTLFAACLLLFCMLI